jgi:4a-hydroxytetrahydrobiopterin dehydratase
MLCRMARIAGTEVRRRMTDLPDWTVEGEVISRQFTFPGFPEAIAFVVRLGFAAEAVDHHPDLHINYKRVKVSYSTHSEGGLTEKDFDGARAATAIAGACGGK